MRRTGFCQGNTLVKLVNIFYFHCYIIVRVYSFYMPKKLIALIAVFIIAMAALATILIWPTNKAMAPTTGGTATTTNATTTAQLPGISDLISVSSPAAHAHTTSPLTVAGEARGNWYFEASFPVELLNASGTVIAQAPAQAQGDWMTSNFVPFALSLPFPAQAAGSSGTLVLKKDNESGDPAKDQSVSIPITF